MDGKIASSRGSVSLPFVVSAAAGHWSTEPVCASSGLCGQGPKERCARPKGIGRGPDAWSPGIARNMQSMATARPRDIRRVALLRQSASLGRITPRSSAGRSSLMS